MTCKKFDTHYARVMLFSFSVSNQRRRRLILFGIILILFTGCQYIPFNIPFLNSKPAPDKASSEVTQKRKHLRKIYIQNFSGQKIKEVQEIFFDAAKEQKLFTFMELLPDDLTGLGVLRIDVTDYQIWEVDETIDNQNNYPAGSLKTGDPIKRRNAIVSMKVHLFDAETGMRIVSRRFSQPFQQIYIGNDAIKNRPASDIELNRLTKMLIFNMLDSFSSSEEKIVAIRYEEGSSHGWLSDKIHNFGNRRLKKGIRYAEAGELDEAIWIWKIYLFSPEKGEPPAVYYQNRAAAYFNLGVALQQKKQWWKAAEMFSSANRIEQKLKYAQAWGNNMQIWLEEQRSPPQLKKTATRIVKAEEKKVDLTEETRPQAVINLEANTQLLLKPRILWPLDPHLKQRKKLDEQKQQ